MFDSEIKNGEEMFQLLSELFPINRSLSGDGVRSTLSILGRELDDLRVFEIPSGTKAFDWTVPPEWNVNQAYIENKDGFRLIDFKNSNLHLVGYSQPIDAWVSREDLLEKVHTSQLRPTAIPYVTSYYEKTWGFCSTVAQKNTLTDDAYHVVIDSEFTHGSLTGGEFILRGDTADEILLSTYICHPSMANNELSGPVVAVAISNFLLAKKSRRYTYRVLFLPETIGAITYLSNNIESMKENTKCGFVLTCVGDDNRYSYLPSRSGASLADRIARHVLNHKTENYEEYSFLDRGSDERQYCSPGVDLPVASIMRSKYGTYPEYHTSDDDLNFVSPNGLFGSFSVLKSCLEILEMNFYFKATYLCEPQMGKRHLYPTLSTVDIDKYPTLTMDFLTFCDGAADLLEIANKLNVYAGSLIPIAQLLLDHQLISAIETPEFSNR